MVKRGNKKNKKTRKKKASAEGLSLPQELEEGPRSGPYNLVGVII